MNLKVVVVILSLLLVAAIGAVVWLYPLAMRPLFDRHDQPLISRTEALRAKEFKGRTTEAFPMVTHKGPQTCVELRTWERDGAGSFTACYDRGRLFETTVNGGY